MKLVTHAIRSLIAPLLIIFGAWAIAFYFILSDELIDEVDDQLEVYSERIMRQWLAGEQIPDSTDGSNNTYYISPVSADELAASRRVEYSFKDVYIHSRKETEPARVMSTIFEHSDGTYWKLTVMTPIYERNEVISTILVLTLILLLVMLVVVIIVFTWVFIRYMRPLYRVLDYLDHYAIGKGKFLENSSDVIEFQRLNDSVKACVDRIEEAYEHERRFIGDVSHELQTPLAICLNRIELMMEDATLTETQFVELAKMQQTLSELIRMNKTLLFLSKIENNQYPERHMVNINAKVHQQLELLQEAFSSKQVEVNISEVSMWVVSANEELMSSLISNLLRNAFLHNVKGGVVDVFITNSSFTIANTGAGESLNTDLLFNRFYKASCKKKHSNGLGLSIAKAICEIHKFDIIYTFENGKHQFSVSKGSEVG